jgi:hypothetical protein
LVSFFFFVCGFLNIILFSFEMFVYNPFTKRIVTVGGAAYKKYESLLSKFPHYRTKGQCKPIVRMTGRGGEKYSEVAAEDFCGTAAGKSPRSFPINTLGRLHAAESYKRYANDQQGLMSCIRRVAARKSKQMDKSKEERKAWEEASKRK